MASIFPSIAQIKNRMHSGHRDMMIRIRDGQLPIPSGCSAGAYRGYKTIYSTLVRWGLVDNTGERSALTKTAEALIGPQQQSTPFAR